MPDPGLPGAILLVAAIIVAVAVVWWLNRAPAGKRRPGAMHSMGRDDTIGYFRDYSGSSSSSGVREEDPAGRWGRDQDRKPPD